ncbi:MAG TPA: lysophospholipid acyltransferase family protein [Anaerolineales bacterium]
MSIPGPQSPPPKPVTDVWQPELVRLPERTPMRRAVRGFLRGLMRAIMRVCLKAELRGMENLPRRGPFVLVINHLGDADVPLLVGALPMELDGFAKIELRSFPILGKVFDWYGVIWLHRGQADRRAMRAALQGLEQGRVIALAPEGRYSLIQGLEDGSDGAAFLARKADVPVVPIALTGTENEHTYRNLRRFRRAPVTLTVGVPFRLGEEGGVKRSERLKEDTRRIMEGLAALLPEEYKGVYGERKKEER